MALNLTSSVVRKIAQKARQTIRWCFHPPLLKGSLPPMLPGGVRLGLEEEEAAVAAVREVMRAKRLFRYFGVSRNPLQKSRVLEFERAFAARVGVQHALAVNSGTSALVCGLVGLGVGPEDEVILPAYTWVSTASAVMAVGAVPVIVEVDESLTLDVEDVRKHISPYTKAIIPVHMRGAPARMDSLMALAEEKGLVVLEDAAQAAGANFQGQAVGSIGHAGAFSFHMTKILAAGEGGMVTTNDDNIYRRALMYQDSAVCPHEGVPIEEWLPGLNLRMSELHAAVAQVQLRRLNSLLGVMRGNKTRLKQILSEELANKGVTFRQIHDVDGDASIALIFFIPDQNQTLQVVSALTDENIQASRLYQNLEFLPRDHVDFHVYTSWLPILAQRSWSARGGPWRQHPRKIEYDAGMCPRTIDLLSRAVHIDINPALSMDQLEQMASGILKVASSHL